MNASADSGAVCRHGEEVANSVSHGVTLRLAWLVAGGLAYTAGVAFYVADRVPYAHFVWHLFVMAGSAYHYVAVLFYAA